MLQFPELNAAAYARHRGVSKQAIAKAIAAGRIPPSAIRHAPDGSRMIDVAAADLALGQNRFRVNTPADEVAVTPTAAAAPGRDPAASASSGLTKARELEATYSARLRELELEQKLGKVVSIADATRAMERCAEVFVRDLSLLAGRADDLVAVALRNGVPGVRVMLKDLERELRSTIAANMRLLAETDDPAEVAEAAEDPAAAAPGAFAQEAASA